MSFEDKSFRSMNIAPRKLGDFTIRTSTKASRRRVFFVLGLVVSALALWLALDGVDGAALFATLAEAKHVLVIPFLVLLFLFYWLKLERWKSLLAAGLAPPGRGQLAAPMVIGFAANNLLPFRIGELIRLVVAAKTTKISKSAILSSLLIERYFDVMSLLLLGALALSQTSNRDGNLPLEQYYLPIAIASIIAIFAFALGARHIVSVSVYAIRALPSRLRNFLAPRIEDLTFALGPLRSPMKMSVLLLNSLVQWGMLSGAIYIACRAVGIEVPITGAVYTMILLAIGVSIPSSPGFIGVIEYCFVLALAAYGVVDERALAAGIVYHSVNWLAITLAGTYYVRKLALSWTRLAGSELEMDAI